MDSKQKAREILAGMALNLEAPTIKREAEAIAAALDEAKASAYEDAAQIIERRGTLFYFKNGTAKAAIADWLRECARFLRSPEPKEDFPPPPDCDASGHRVYCPSRQGLPCDSKPTPPSPKADEAKECRPAEGYHTSPDSFDGMMCEDCPDATMAALIEFREGAGKAK